MELILGAIMGLIIGAYLWNQKFKDMVNNWFGFGDKKGKKK